MRILSMLAAIFLVPGLVFAGDWVGAPAPAVSLPNQAGQLVDLAALRGQWVVLYFYPKNNTPGCTEEARQFRDYYPKLQAKNIAVVGVSVDDVKSHQGFAEKLQLPFTLLADTDGAAARAFGVLKGFGPVKFAARETFLIDPAGVIVYHYAAVNARDHAAQVLVDVERLQQQTLP